MDYSIVIPVYNSETTLDELFIRIKNVFDNLNKSFEVILIEDCGFDESWEKIEKLKKTYPDIITGIKLSKNFGQHNAILCGFNYVKGEFIITIDDDLQNPPEEILKLIDEQKKADADLVYGVYETKKHNKFRNMGSSFLLLIFKMIFRTKITPTSFRLIKTNLIKKISTHKQSFVFIDGLLHWYTQFITHTNVEHHNRKSSESGYNFIKLIKLASNLLFNFTTIPLRLIIYLGVIFSFISFIMGIIFIIRKLIYEIPLGYTSIIVSIFFVASILLLLLGVVGEYVSRVFSTQNNKPPYSIKKIED